MKNLIKILIQFLYILLLGGLISCSNTGYNPETLTKYHNWVVVQKPYSHPLINGYTRYSMDLQKNDTVRRIWTYEYYYEKYEIGDTVFIDGTDIYAGHVVEASVDTGRDWDDFGDAIQFSSIDSSEMVPAVQITSDSSIYIKGERVFTARDYTKYIKWVDSCNDSIKYLRMMGRYGSIEEAKDELMEYRRWTPHRDIDNNPKPLTILKTEWRGPEGYWGVVGIVYEIWIMSAEEKKPTFKGFIEWIGDK
jgi:hypothetical protein